MAERKHDTASSSSSLRSKFSKSNLLAKKEQVKERMSMAARLHKSYRILQHILEDPTSAQDHIPVEIIAKCKGIALLSQVKAGFIFSGTVGAGIIMIRHGDIREGRRAWSPPCSIGTAGAGWGLQVGAQHTETLIILNTDQAVEAFSGAGQLRLGGDLSVAAGPVGRSAQASVVGHRHGVAAVYSYSRSKGVFAGISLEGEVLAVRKDDNADFYGRRCTAGEILSGAVQVPQNEDYEKILECLNRIDEDYYSRHQPMDAAANSGEYLAPSAPPAAGPNHGSSDAVFDPERD